MNPSHKRPRTTDYELAPRSPVRSEPWFNDGNIVIWVGHIQFRVHRGVLSRHSVIFRDMFGLAEPEAGGQMVDGCPVVHLSDASEDVRHVLEALYENRSYNFNDPKPETFAVIAAFLRLGKKYEIDSLKAEAVHRLVAHFPSSLKDWDKSLTANGPKLIQYYCGLEFDIVNLAREHRLFYILPAAFYACSLFSMRDILRGLSVGPREAISLSTYDRDICLLGRDRLINDQRQTTFEWLEIPSPTCIEEQGCDGAKRDIGIPVLTCVALMPWQADWRSFLCWECDYDGRRMHDTKRAALWNDLPSYFELPPWGVLLRPEESWYGCNIWLPYYTDFCG